MNPQIAAAGISAAAQEPLVVRAGESQTGSPIRFLAKETFVKLAAGSTACPVSVLEDVRPSHHGPPLHAHVFEEFFYILTGEFLFEVNGKPAWQADCDCHSCRATESGTGMGHRSTVRGSAGGERHSFALLIAPTEGHPEAKRPLRK